MLGEMLGIQDFSLSICLFVLYIQISLSRLIGAEFLWKIMLYVVSHFHENYQYSIIISHKKSTYIVLKEMKYFSCEKYR